MGNGKRARTQLQEEKWLFINDNKQNKQKQLHRGKTDWQAGKARQGKAGQGRAGQGRAGQGRAGQGRTQGIHSIQHKMANQHQTCKHKEILKGENEEGNEG